LGARAFGRDGARRLVSFEQGLTIIAHALAEALGNSRKLA